MVPWYYFIPNLETTCHKGYDSMAPAMTWYAASPNTERWSKVSPKYQEVLATTAL